MEQFDQRIGSKTKRLQKA